MVHLLILAGRRPQADFKTGTQWSSNNGLIYTCVWVCACVFSPRRPPCVRLSVLFGTLLPLCVFCHVVALRGVTWAVHASYFRREINGFPCCASGIIVTYWQEPRMNNSFYLSLWCLFPLSFSPCDSHPLSISNSSPLFNTLFSSSSSRFLVTSLSFLMNSLQFSISGVAHMLCCVDCEKKKQESSICRL